MASLRQLASTWSAAAGLSVMVAGCTSLPKNPFSMASKEPAKPAVTVGSGDFAPNNSLKDPSKVHLAYGQWQEQMGQQVEARDSYHKVLAEQPKNLDAILGLARIDQNAGLMSDAETRLKKASKLAPKDPRVLATYGNFYAAQRDWKKAIDKHQAAVKYAPDDPRYQFLLGVALARSGDVDTAYPHFVRSVGEAQAHYNLGYILSETGDRAGSLAHLERALQLKPDLAVAETMIERLNQEADGPVLAQGTDRSRAGLAAAPVSGVRAVPVTTTEESNRPPQNRSMLPKVPLRRASASQQTTAAPPPPAGLTPAQLEQWRNQQGQ